MAVIPGLEPLASFSAKRPPPLVDSHYNNNRFLLVGRSRRRTSAVEFLVWLVRMPEPSHRTSNKEVD